MSKKYVVNKTEKSSNGEWLYINGEWVFKKQRFQVVKIYNSKPHKFSYIIFT